jgi:hypothetical protein
VKRLHLTRRDLLVVAVGLVVGLGLIFGSAGAVAATPEQIAVYNAVADQALPAGRCAGKAVPTPVAGSIKALVDDVGTIVEADGIADGVYLDDADPSKDTFYDCSYRITTDLSAYETCLVVLHERLHLEGVHHDLANPLSLMTDKGIQPDRIRDRGCMAAVGAPALTESDVYDYTYEHLRPKRGWTTMRCVRIATTAKRCVIAFHRAGRRTTHRHYRFWRDASWGISVARLK